MPVEFEIEHSPSILSVRYIGRVELNDILESFARYSAHPEFDLARPQLVDLTDFVTSNGTYQEINSLAAIFDRAAGDLGIRLRLAIHAPGDLGFGFARMFESAAELRENLACRVFTDREDARNWLSAN